MESKYINIEDKNFHYYESGAGDPIILLHGVGGASKTSWEKNIPALSENFKVYAFDMIGHGYSEKPKKARQYKLSHAVNLLDKFMSAKEIEMADLIGNSMGGLISIAFAEKFPEKTRKMVLVGSGGLGKEVSYILRILSFPVIGNFLKPNIKRTKKALEHIIYDKKIIDEDLIEEVYKFKNQDKAHKSFLKAVRKGINLFGQKEKINYLEKIREINSPIYIIWGAQDEVIPVEHAYKAYEELKNAGRNVFIKIFDGCGHWPQREKYKEFNNLVADFLKRKD